MALESLTSNELLNFIIYDTISATPNSYQDYSLETSFLMENNIGLNLKPQDPIGTLDSCCLTTRKRQSTESLEVSNRKQSLGAQGRKKRRRKPRVCKNEEEAEAQRMTHIAVERNRRKQMNDYLAVLRSLMPESYVQRGDQASIVGGAIQFVKELEHLLQTLEVQKLQLVGFRGTNQEQNMDSSKLLTAPFSQFFVHPQYSWSQPCNKRTEKTKAAMADIEVTLIETHANLRILTRRNPKQLVKLVTGLQTLQLTIIHLNVTAMDPLVLYSVNVKVEEGCLLTSVDDIASAVHQMLRIIDVEAGATAAALC